VVVVIKTQFRNFMKIKIVDGFKIRNTLDNDFCVIGDRSIYPYIKQDEVWFEKIFLPEKAYLLSMFKKKKQLVRKVGYEKAKKILRSAMKGKDLGEIRIRLLQKKLIGEGKKGVVKIFLVKGAEVRKFFDPDFCFGGHWLVYDYIPKGEIWIDDVAEKQERKYIIIHEVYEVGLMQRGKSYNNAHDFATAAEKEAKRNNGIAKYLKD